MANVRTINLDTLEVLLDDGTVLPITDMFDDDGEECDADEAVSIVAGIQGVGFLAIDMDDLMPITVH